MNTLYSIGVAMPERITFSGKTMVRMTETVLLVICLLAMTSLNAESKLYKWTDKDGKVHYGDKIPPDSVEFKHAELNEYGVVVKSVDRQKTREELDADKLVEKKIREEKEQQRKELVAKQVLDTILLDTFTTERDLLLTRKDRINSVDSMINLTDSNNRTLEQQIKTTQIQIEGIQKNGQEVPDNIIKKLENLKGQQSKNLKFMEEQNMERKRIVEQFDKDLLRYRELKGAEGQVTTEEAIPDTKEVKLNEEKGKKL